MVANDMSALLEEANRLVDDEKTRAKGLELLRKVVKDAPKRVDAAYYLAWALVVADQSSANADEIHEVRALLANIVQQTRALLPTSSEPSLEARARAFALSWPLPERCVRATEAELSEYAKHAAAAHALRPTMFSQAAARAVQMGMAWARARAQAKPEAGFQRLLDWVKAHPRHERTMDSAWMKDGDESKCPPTVSVSSAGLDPFFDDPGYLAWVRTQKPTKLAHPVDLLVTGMCAAAGEDHAGTKTSAGRRGRILSLRALGAPIEGIADTPTIGGYNPLTTAARFADVSTVRFLVEEGAPVNGNGSNVPLIAVVIHGDIDAARMLLEAGADPHVEVTYKGGMQDSAMKRAKKNQAMLALLRAGKAAPPPAKKAGGLDTGPARAAWKARKKSFHKAKWADGDEDLEPFFDLLDEEGTPTWEAVAKHLETLDPNELLALALILKTVTVPGRPTSATAITKKDHQKARIVIGNAIAKGDALLGSCTDWLVTGDLHVEGRFSNDEAARVTVGGDMTGTMVETEGELLVGGDLAIDQVVWADYEAGTLVVGGTLRTSVLVQHNHGVIAAKYSVTHRLKDTSSKAAGNVFPAEAFEDGTLDGGKLWALVRAPQGSARKKSAATVKKTGAAAKKKSAPKKASKKRAPNK